MRRGGLVGPERLGNGHLRCSGAGRAIQSLTHLLTPLHQAIKCDDTHQVVKLFSLNDYLGLSTHPAVCAAAADAARALGNGPRSSALVGGFTTLHRDLELSLANLCGALGNTCVEWEGSCTIP